jgi:hypothetical protein
VPDRQYARVAGCVIARQRPGTAKGFVFLSLEDETGISNVIVNPDLYEKYRVVINREKFLRVEGVLQNQDHTISIKAFPRPTHFDYCKPKRNPMISTSYHAYFRFAPLTGSNRDHFPHADLSGPIPSHFRVGDYTLGDKVPYTFR